MELTQRDTRQLNSQNSYFLVSQNSLYNNFISLQRRISKGIQQGQVIDSKNQFQLQQKTIEYPRFINNRNTSVQLSIVPQSPFVQSQGMPSLFILPYEDSKWFQPLASMASYTQISVTNKQQQLIWSLERKKKILHELAIACKDSLFMKKSKKQEAHIIKYAISQSQQVYSQILKSQTQRNVSEAFINQIMQERGSIGVQGNISHLIYKKSTISSILELIPLNMQAERLGEVFPGDSHLQRFTALYLLKAFQCGQKYAVISLPDGNQKVLLRYLSTFYKINKSPQLQHSNRSLIIFTQNGLSFIQNEDFRSFYNSVTVKIVLIDQDCRIQRNPGRERSRKHEMYNFSSDKMEFFKIQEKTHQNDVFVFESGYTVNIVIVEMAALDKEEDLQKAIRQVQEATKIYEYDSQVVYHLDSYMRKKGLKKLPFIQTKFKIVILSEMNPRSWVDIIQILLCDQVREADVKIHLQDKCRNYLKNVYYKPTQAIIEKSVCTIEYQEKKIYLSGKSAELANEYSETQLLGQVASIILDEQLQPHLSILQDSPSIKEGLQNQIYESLSNMKFQNQFQDSKVASCLQEDLPVLCAKTMMKFVQHRSVQLSKPVIQQDQTICQAMYQMERLQQCLSTNKDSLSINLDLPIKLNRVSAYNKSKRLDIDIFSRNQLKKQLKIVSRDVIRRLPVQLQFRFTQAALQEKVGRDDWRRRAVKYSQSRNIKVEYNQFLFPDLDILNISLSPFEFVTEVYNKVQQNLQFIQNLPQKQFQMRLPYDIVCINPTSENKIEFVTKQQASHTFFFQSFDINSHIDNVFITIQDSDFPQNKLCCLPRQQKHPIFVMLDNILNIQVQKYFETETIIQKANKIKINLIPLRVITKIIIFCDINDVSIYRSYLSKQYAFIYKQCRFLVTADLLEIISYNPSVLIITPGPSQKKVEYAIKEMVFKANVQVHNIQIDQFQFNQTYKKVTEDRVINACNLIPKTHYLKNRIDPYLQGSKTFEKQIEQQVVELQKCLKYNTGIYNLLRASMYAPQKIETNINTQEQINYKIYTNTFSKHLQMGNGAYLCINDKQLNEQKYFIKLFIKNSIKLDKILYYNHCLRLSKQTITPISTQQKQTRQNHYKPFNYYKFIGQLDTFMNFKGQITQLDGINILQKASIFIKQNPFERCYLPRCCMMQDISQYLFQVIQIIQKHSTPVSQVKLFTIKESFYDQMLHYMDSLHLYAYQTQSVPHVDLKSISLAIQYQRIQYSQQQQQMPQQQLQYLHKVFQHIHQQFVEQPKYFSLQSQLNVFATLSKRIHSNYNSIFVQSNQNTSQNIKHQIKPPLYLQLEQKLKQDLTYQNLLQISSQIYTQDKNCQDGLKFQSISGFCLNVNRSIFITESKGNLKFRHNNELFVHRHEFERKNIIIGFQGTEATQPLQIDCTDVIEGISLVFDLL
ncbi:hypothetical protein SS50377_24673 [Spironucleus salmonicida]|uniref:Uncharacterized protein n=1 Tax=Spironucleus salmonicida TaxID=348837 RepID=V6LIU5_9EUKA|nr:hypothetical protein SS50377_24673 [Spironucleus salmonicida]|eukprot:EST44482.1 Hypothetical protein SS50377_15479 [Spironucleus salmonicida]